MPCLGGSADQPWYFRGSSLKKNFFYGNALTLQRPCEASVASMGDMKLDTFTAARYTLGRKDLHISSAAWNVLRENSINWIV